MNYNDYATQARLIEHLQKERFGVEIRWTEELYIENSDPNKDWLVFRKVAEDGTLLPRVLHRLGDGGNLEYKNYPNAE